MITTATRFAGNILEQGYAREAGRLTRIALPLIMASLVNMSIAITDVIMMGWLGPTQLAAGAVVSDFYSLFYYLVAGVIAAISPLISQARGAGNLDHVRSITQQGFLVGILLAIPGGWIVYHSEFALRTIGIADNIITISVPYAQMMAFTFVAMMAFNVMHYFLASHEKSRIIFLATLCGMPINALGNYIFMFGHFGFDAMGLAGAGLSSVITACFMFLAVLVYVIRYKAFKSYSLLSKWRDQQNNYIPELIHIGVPIGVANLGQMGVFLLSTVTMGVFGAEVLAAHAVTLRMAGVVFAIPTGFAQAATVRISFVLGAQEHDSLFRIMRTALAISITLGTIMLVSLIAWNVQITHGFLGSDISVAILAQATLFLAILAINQPFSNLGVVGSGILRGFKDTRTPMLCSLTGFWGISFVGGWSLAFLFNAGGLGIWIGLTSGTIVYGLLVAYHLYQRFAPRSQLMGTIAIAGA
ncbi:MAG: MATE family efflux transporter [Gammaproteobacteria bacterium]|nr:MATE family efflux transporter [Gammaproteobacteria bacterium]